MLKKFAKIIDKIKRHLALTYPTPQLGKDVIQWFINVDIKIVYAGA